MDKLIQQIAKLKNPNLKPSEAEGEALKEIVLSGLSRSGFLKETFYLSGLDYKDGDAYCLCFLRQSENGIISLSKCLPVLKNEFTAYGIDSEIKETDSGFSFDYENIHLYGFVYHKDFNLKPEYSYQHVPLSYELRTVKPMREGERNEIQQAMTEQLFRSPVEEKKKKGASKAPKKSKAKTETQDHWVQPSLFDF